MPFCMLWGQLRSLPLTSPFPTLIRVVIKQPGARNHTDVNNYACQLEVHRVMIGVIDFRLYKQIKRLVVLVFQQMA